ncbi:unnamed protein product [Closterium sp. NIES-64]|nr:unnamed protein product [Closterium sp. NIES-64]CAI5990722.1 unnamed protein product [Closterium sp. NIES-64]
MVTQTFCNLAACNSSISRDVADLTVHYWRDALANLEEVRDGNEERRRQAETAARFHKQVDTRLSNLQESIVRVSDQVRQSGGGMAEGMLKGVEERLREVLREDSERQNRDGLQDKEWRQKEMREGMKEMKEAMMKEMKAEMKEMKAEMKEMKDGIVNQIVGRLSAVLREESERQKKARQEDAERRQQQDAKRKQVADDEERQKKKQLDEQWRKEEEEKRKDVEATKRRRKKKHQEEERWQKEVEAGMKEVMEAMKEMKTGMKGWKEGRLKKRARLPSYVEQQRQLEAKAKAMAEETEQLAREMEEEDLTMHGEGTWKGVEEEIAEGLGSLLLIESGEANVAEGVAIVPGQNVEVSRRRPRQEDRESEGHAAKRPCAAGIQELISIIPGEKKGMKIDKGDNRKNAVVDDKEEHAVGLAATLSVMWAASTNVDHTQWETGATTAARGTSTAIASSAARSSTAATASSAASSSSAVDVSSAVLDALATLAASVACVAVEAMRSVKDQEHDKEAWILPLSDALLKALPAESRAAGDTKRMTRVVAKVVTSWCLCSMASRGLRQHQGVCLGVLQKKLGGRDTTRGADKEKKTKKLSAKKNATKDASTEENTGTGG